MPRNFFNMRSPPGTSSICEEFRFLRDSSCCLFLSKDIERRTECQKMQCRHIVIELFRR